MEVLETKVEALREGSVLVTPEERLEVQAAYDHKLGLWRRRKKIYQELWGMITESMTENLKNLKVFDRQTPFHRIYVASCFEIVSFSVQFSDPSSNYSELGKRTHSCGLKSHPFTPRNT